MSSWTRLLARMPELRPFKWVTQHFNLTKTSWNKDWISWVWLLLDIDQPRLRENSRILRLGKWQTGQSLDIEYTHDASQTRSWSRTHNFAPVLPPCPEIEIRPYALNLSVAIPFGQKNVCPSDFDLHMPSQTLSNPLFVVGSAEHSIILIWIQKFCHHRFNYSFFLKGSYSHFFIWWKLRK